MIERPHNGKSEYDDVCPHCGGQGFDGQGSVLVDDMTMVVKRCWNCGTRFAVELPGVRDE
jgi:transcription elongation factor Elf1